MPKKDVYICLCLSICIYSLYVSVMVNHHHHFYFCILAFHSFNSVFVCVEKSQWKLFVNRVVCMYVFFSFFHITRYIFFILSPLYFQLFSSFFLSLETNFSRPAATYTHTQTNFHLDILRCRHKHLFEKNDIFICQRTFFFALYHKWSQTNRILNLNCFFSTPSVCVCIIRISMIEWFSHIKIVCNNIILIFPVYVFCLYIDRCCCWKSHLHNYSFNDDFLKKNKRFSFVFDCDSSEKNKNKNKRSFR